MKLTIFLLLSVGRMKGWLTSEAMFQYMEGKRYLGVVFEENPMQGRQCTGETS